MMTVLELINALEAKRGDYDDPIVIERLVVGQDPHRFEIVDIELCATGDGELHIIVSRVE